MMPVEIRQHSTIKGTLFGARQCSSCSCDPCDCDPCTCGDDKVAKLPQWRVSGCIIQTGYVRSVDVSHVLLLSLSQAIEMNEMPGWQEVILVNELVSTEQILAILPLIEERLKSLPAEAGSLPILQKAVYQMPMSYEERMQGPFVQVVFEPEQATLVRPGGDRQQAELRSWKYDGLLALRGSLELLAKVEK